MDLEETLGKIKAVLEKKYRAANVGFGRKTFDKKWPDTPYMEFNLKYPEDGAKLDKFQKYCQKKVQKGKKDYVTIYVMKQGNKEPTYRIVPVVIKKGSEEEKQRDLQEMAERFYNILKCLIK